MTQPTKRIIILGGGFGGLYTALRLHTLPWEDSVKPEIILVDKNDRFVFSPLLYELVTGEMQSWEIAPPFEELLADTQIRFIQDCVIGIDVNAKQVKLENTPALNYDRLVISMGGNTPINIIAGAKEYAIGFRTLSDAYRLNERLRQLESAASDYIRVAVVGGGYSGVELACKLADRLGKRGKIRLIDRGDMILKTATEFNRETAMKTLEAKKIWLDLETEIESIKEKTISLIYKGQVDTIDVDVVLWTVGTQVTSLIQDLPLPHNAQGLLKTNALLQVIDNPEIYALGDIADCLDATGQQVPPTAQAALQESDYCAWNIWASLKEKPLLPFRYQALGEMMTLGIENAALTSLGIKLDGMLASVARKLVYLYRLPTVKHQMSVGFNWICAPIVEMLKQ